MSPLFPTQIASFKTRVPGSQPARLGDVVVRGRRVLGIVTDDVRLPGQTVMLQVYGFCYARLGESVGRVGPHRELPFGFTTGWTRPDGLTPVFVQLIGHNSSAGLL